MADPGVDDEEFEAGGCESEGDDLGREAPAVQKHRSVGLAEQRRRLVHDAGRGANDTVLGELANPGQGRTVEVQTPHIVESHRDGAFERG